MVTEGRAGLVAMVALVKLADVPKHLQYNRYILTGYRPQLCVRGCARSITYAHNESGNILTHGEELISLCLIC